MQTHLKPLTLPKVLRRLWQRRAIADVHIAPKRARHPDFALNPAGQRRPHFRSLHVLASLLAHSLLDKSTGSIGASTTFPAASVFFVSSAVQHVRLCRRRCILRFAGRAKHLGSAALPDKQGVAQSTALTVGGAILLSAEELSLRWSNEAGKKLSMRRTVRKAACPLLGIRIAFCQHACHLKFITCLSCCTCLQPAAHAIDLAGHMRVLMSRTKLTVRHGTVQPPPNNCGPSCTS